VKSEKVDIQMSGIIDATYLPFTEDELRPHFLRGPDEQISHFTESARRYHEFFNENNLDVRQDRARGPCQIEKDERFWTATALKKLVEAPDGVDLLAALLSKAFDSPRPPLAAFDDWRNCLTGNLHLALEASLPSPPSYCSWLRENGSRQHFIPYVGRAREHNTGGNLEGATSVDAVIVNVDNGFGLLIEAKVLSDISTTVSFDAFRNQIARSIDIMLEEGQGPKWLAARKARDSLFALLTPRCFKERPHSRLYGFLYEEYKDDPAALARDLPHRDENWADLARRLGWFTFEDVNDVLPGACPWLKQS
jgi:hypothetical protein